MSAPALLQGSYRLGMKRDFSRDQLPAGAVWNLIDWLPEVLNTRLRERGGYSYASQDIAGVQASAAYIAAGIVAEFTDGQSILAFDEDGRVYEVESTSSTENIGAALTTVNPVFYSNMVIVPDSAATVGPKKITRSAGAHTIANLGGTPPAGKYALIYKDVLWLARTSSNLDRIYFSFAGNPESWDTTNKYLDSSYPITGMAALSNAVFVFSLGRTMRVRGSVPPPDSDFIVDDPIFEVGCTDNRSIALYRDKVIWANAQGLYISDGTALEDLTRICGMKSWWRDVMKGREGFSTGTEYSPSGFSIVAGIYGDYYFYCIMNGSTLVDSGMIDLTKYAWHRLANIDSVCFFPRIYPEELFFGRRGAARVASLSSIFAKAAGVKNDANGTAVLSQLELPYFVGQPGLKTMQRLYVGYDLRDAATDNPTLDISYVDTPESTSYTSLGSLAETTTYTREHLALNFPAYGIGLKIGRTAASGDARLYDIEIDANPRERNR